MFGLLDIGMFSLGKRERKHFTCGVCDALAAGYGAPAVQAAPKPPAPVGARSYQPQEILDKFKKLQAGDKAVYMPIAYDTLITDQWGRYWSLGIVDLKWHRYENKQWVRDEPNGSLRMSRRSDAFFSP